MARIRIGIAVILLCILAISGKASAEDPRGIWLVEDRDAKIQVSACDSFLCGTIVWIKDPIDPTTARPWLDKNNIDSSKSDRPLLGLAIVSDMKPSETPGRWTGHVYSIDRGRNFDGSLTLLNPTTLKVEGCLLFICQSEIWTRVE